MYIVTSHKCGVVVFKIGLHTPVYKVTVLFIGASECAWETKRQREEGRHGIDKGFI